jgi:hypothetical protein
MRPLGPVARAARILAVAALVLVGAVPNPAEAQSPDHEDAIEAFARDVFVVVGASLRNPDATTDPGEPLYNVVGLNLGVTWGEWRAASASSTAYVSGGGSPVTTLRLDLAGLVPDGVYSVFYATIGPDTEHPLCPGVERLLPLESTRQRQSPDPSSFVADSEGSARFVGRVDGDLLDADQAFLAVIYHADGLTYHPLPNRGESLTQGESCRSSFGHDAMRQMLILQKWTA